MSKIYVEEKVYDEQKGKKYTLKHRYHDSINSRT